MDGPFSNAARNLRQVFRSPGSWAWVGIILGVELLVMGVGGPNRQPALSWYLTFGLNREGVFDGKVWELLTYGFLHGGWWHAGLNSLCILLVGSRVEHMAGTPAMVKVMLYGVVGGGIGHLLLAPGGAGAPLLVGLSGGCVAMLLVMTTLSPQSRMMPVPLSGKNLGLGILAVALILALIHPDSWLPGFADAGKSLKTHGLGAVFDMGHACHFGGGLAGWLYGRWLLRPRVTLARLRRDRERREAGQAKRGSAQR